MNRREFFKRSAVNVAAAVAAPLVAAEVMKAEPEPVTSVPVLMNDGWATGVTYTYRVTWVSDNGDEVHYPIDWVQQD